MKQNLWIKPLSVLLALLIPYASVAQPVRPFAPAKTSGVSQELPGESAPQFNPKLRGKKVTVYLRDGRAYKGKVKQASDDSLTLEVKENDPVTNRKAKHRYTFSTSQVVLIEKQRRKKLLWLALGTGGVMGGEAWAERQREKDEALVTVLPPISPGQFFRINPELLGRQIIVVLHTGQTLEGKLLEVTQQSLLLRVPSGWNATGEPNFTTRQVALQEMDQLDLVRQPPKTRGRWWLAPVIGIVLFVGLIVLLAIGLNDPDF